ncbi:MAG: DUF3024 domain-containing protein [Chitinophagaceae bacterium]|nr:DUF3024 domain-containing protein [Chitinophagaceae bacterium]
MREYPVDKTTFGKAKNHGKIFWLRADLNWHTYTPKSTVKKNGEDTTWGLPKC